MVTSATTAVYLVSMMLSIGIGLRPVEKPRGGVWRALLLDIVLIPALAVGLTRALHLSSDVGLALMIVAVSAGGRFAPHLTRISGGDVAGSVRQTLILTKVAVVAAPLAIQWLLGVHGLHVAAFPLMVKGVLLQLLPFYLGRAIGRRRPELARKIERPLANVVIAAMVLALVPHLARGGLESVALLGDRGWIAVGALIVATLAFGWMLGGRTLIVGGLSRNLALALLFAEHAFPHSRVPLAVFAVWLLLAGAGSLLAILARPRRCSDSYSVLNPTGE
jgi:predicted Na+-dependent transporter